MNEPETEKPITHVGFFHFGTRAEGRPVETLERKLKSEEAKGTDLSKCLLVLPEAFNIVGNYQPVPANPTIAPSLIKLSKDKNIALVVGLKTKHLRCSGPFNCAYLIDGCTWKHLACKACQDLTGGYVERLFFREIVHRGYTIAALICVDATMDGTGCPRRATLHKKLWDVVDKAHQLVLCVPAHFTTGTPQQVAEFLGTKPVALIVANSSEYPSLICVQGVQLPVDESDSKSPYCSFIRFAEITS
jgi:hypothetical protein